MSGFVKYSKPIDFQTMKKEMEARLKDYRESVKFFRLVYGILKGWEGKQISKRMTTYVDKQLPENTWSALEFSFSSISMRFYRKQTEPTYRNERFMTLSIGSVDNKTFSMDALNIEVDSYQSLEESADKLEVGLKALPLFVKEYNEILSRAQALVEEATKVKMEYDFDIITRGTNEPDSAQDSKRTDSGKYPKKEKTSMNNKQRHETFDEALKILKQDWMDARPGSAHKQKLSHVYASLKKIAEERTRVAVFMDGGLIQEIYSDSPVEVMKIDLDVEGAEEEELTPYPDREGEPNKAYISLEKSGYGVDVDEEYIDTLWNNLNKED